MALLNKSLYRYFILFIVLLGSCGISEQADEVMYQGSNMYAEHFQILEYENYLQLNILNPWQESTGIMYTYYLANDSLNIPDSIANRNVIITPLKKVICMSTTQVAFIDQIGALNSICGVSGKKYVYNKNIFGNKCIKDVGYDSGINYELIIDLSPDLVLLYGVNSEVTGIAKKLNDLDIKTIIIAEYLESSPLARLEWIKVFGALFNEQMKADTFFTEKCLNYNRLVSEFTDTLFKPSILTGLPFRDIWYVSSAKTIISGLITDAGGKYIWSDLKDGDINTFDIEAVISRSGHADIWINTGIANSKKEILAMDNRLKHISAFKKDQVYNNNKRINRYGGNDYFESGILNPDLVLMDMMKITHPDFLTDHEFHYYNKLK